MAIINELDHYLVLWQLVQSIGGGGARERLMELL